MILDKKGTTKALISLHGCAQAGLHLCCSQPPPEDRFSRDEAHIIKLHE